MEKLVKKLPWLLAVAAALLAARFLWPCLLPFLPAYLAAALIEPAVQTLSRRLNLRRGFASAFCVLVLLAAVAGLFAFVFMRAVYEAVDFLKALPELLAGVPELLARLEHTAEQAIARAPAEARGYLSGLMDGLVSRAAELPLALSTKALAWLSGLAAKAPGTFLSWATFVIGTFFLSADFPAIHDFLRRQIPERLRRSAGELRRDVLHSAGRWLRAEATLMLVTFLELTAAFLLLRVRYAAVVAAITAFIDALPVFGTGVVLLPWAAVSALSGDMGLAAGLAATYLAVTLARNLLEPRLLGRQFGISPAAALVAMYAGFRLAGVAGMVLFPPGLMLLKLLNDKGTIHLWKEKEEPR